MFDPTTTGVIAAATLTGLFAACHAALKGWQGWLDYKRLELASHLDGEVRLAPVGGRIEIADLRERVRKLEEIASGIDL